MQIFNAENKYHPVPLLAVYHGYGSTPVQAIWQTHVYCFRSVIYTLHYGLTYDSALQTGLAYGSRE